MGKPRVVLDTNTLRADPTLTSGGFEALARFAEEGYVDVILPRVVVSEFFALPSAKLEALANLRKTLKDLRKQTPDKLHESIGNFEDTMRAEFDLMDKSAQTALEAWIKRTGATIEESKPEHTSRVLDKYFGGVPPFRHVKSRDDFPDAFIYECIADLAKDGEILTVGRDKGLSGALATTKNVVVYPSLKELLESDEFDDLRTEVETENVDRAIEALRSDKDLFQYIIDNGVVGALGGTFIDDPSTAVDHEPAEELYLETVGRVVEWEVGDDVDYLGEGIISVDFTATVEVSVDTSTGNEYLDDIYGASAERRVEVSGALSVQMDVAELRKPASDWSGVKLGNIARIEVDELHDTELLD